MIKSILKYEKVRKKVHYEKCLQCDKLGKSCNCMSFVTMSAQEIIEWCKARKTMLHMTNESLASISGVPLGTVNRIFAGKSMDYHYETLRPIIKALVSGEWDGDKCHTTEAVPEHHADTIKRLELENEHLKQETDFLRKQSQAEIAMLLPLLKFRKHTIVVLGVLLGLALSVIIGALVIDRLNPNIGFFWLS